MATRNDTKNTQKFNEREYARKLVKMGFKPDEAEIWAQRTAERRVSEPDTVTTSLTSLTRVKSISDYAAEALALDQEEAERAGAIGFMARAMVQASLPHSKQEGNEYRRRNGDFLLAMWSPIGLPYGTIPRLILSWVTTEAVRTKSRELVLGESLSTFLGNLGLSRTGGKRGDITRLKEQMQRLLSSAITCTYDNGKRFAMQHVTPFESASLWWDPKDPEQLSLWQSILKLSPNFFAEITSAPVPICMSTLEFLRASSQALDLYLWLTYRNFYARRESRIPWEALQRQFGAGYPETALGKRHFKSKFLEALKKVAEVYPEARKLRAETDVLVYVPGYPDVAPITPSTLSKKPGIYPH
jgi:hypothetical protein